MYPRASTVDLLKKLQINLPACISSAFGDFYPLKMLGHPQGISHLFDRFDYPPSRMFITGAFHPILSNSKNCFELFQIPQTFLVQIFLQP